MVFKELLICCTEGCPYLYRVYLGDVGEVGAIEEGPLGPRVLLQHHRAGGGGPGRGGCRGGLDLDDNTFHQSRKILPY